jgi:glutamate carboxypeptidase
MKQAEYYFTQHLNSIIHDIERLVRAESPSQNKELADQCKDVLQSFFQTYFNKRAVEYEMTQVGNHLAFSLGDVQDQILLVGHYDTVWEPNQLEYRETSDKIYGPGILDMKASLISAIWLLKYIHDYQIPLKRKIVLFINSDEEIGSVTSRSILEREAAKSEAAFILEPPVVGTGALKTARKGTSRYKLNIKGVSAHAGNNPQDGVSAIKEAAKQILNIDAQANQDAGTTINVGIVEGGGKLNVIPNEAHLEVDVRAQTKAEQYRIDSFFERLQAMDARIDIEVEGGINRPPMEKTAESKRLFQIAEDEAEELGFQLKEAKVGGASDGNFTSQLCPTLDGLGFLGGGIHAEHEHILRDAIVERMALLTHTVLEYMIDA